MKDQEHMSWKEFNEACLKIAKWIRNENTQFKSIYGIPRGGLIVAVRLSHLLSIPIVLDLKDIKWNTLIVDDIADTGKTLLSFKCEDNYLCVVTLYYHQKSIIKPDFWVLEKKDKWIVFPWERKI